MREPGPDDRTPPDAQAPDTGEPSEGVASELPGILAAAASGDQGAWRRIVDLYSRRVFALAKSRVRRADLAEEITQSVFVTIATKLGAGQYAEEGKFEPWLFRVAVNRIRDEIRRLRRHAEPTDPEQLSQRVSDDGGGMRGGGGGAKESEDLAPLRRAMANLSDADREIIELRHHAGLPFATIAGMLDEPLGTLLARHHRALKKLKDVLTREAAEKQTEDDA